MNQSNPLYSWHILLFGLITTVGACRTPSSPVSDAKDVATNSTPSGASSGVYLYFREDQSISRTQCPAGQLLVNDIRANCTSNKQSVPAKPFIDAISVGVGDTIDQHAKNVQDLYAGISTIDNELLQLLAAAPATQVAVQTLQQQLTTAETGIAAVQVQLNGLDQQIAAIKARLAAQSDVDLNLQLGQLLDQRASALSQENQAKADEQTKRERLIAANSTSLDQETFQDVESQKNTFQQQLDAENVALTSAMQEVADLNKTIAHISDAAFTFDVIEGQPQFGALKPFTRRFQAAFAALSVVPGTSAPLFSPTSFVVGTKPTISFPAALPAWAVYVAVTIDDGQPALLPAAAQLTLPLATDVARTHSITVVLVNALNQRSQPSPAKTLSVIARLHASQLAAGDAHTCALADGTVTCWGNNDSGQTAVPSGLTNVTQIAAGDKHTCAVANGGVTCWGNNDSRQITVPPGLTNVTQVAAGSKHSCVLANRTVTCWGNNDAGQIAVPSGLTDVTLVTAGTGHTCVRTHGAVLCWGNNADGQAVTPSDLNDVTQIAARFDTSCALAGGDVTCWGDNREGQGTAPAGLAHVTQIAAGGDFTCALSNGAVTCWGYNGDGRTAVPSGLATATQIAAGVSFGCAIASGAVSCWGSNLHGETTVPAELAP